MGLHEIREVLHNQRNGHHIEEAAQRMGENLFQLYIGQGINNKNMQETQKMKLPTKLNDQMKKSENELNKPFSKEKFQMIKKLMKKCSTFLAIKETQMKTRL
jgi:hypothetical protein